MKLELRDIRLVRPDFTLAVDLTLELGCVGLSGPSGAGKTTLLDLIAGLARAGSARISLDDWVLTDVAAGLDRPPDQRRIGYVPQDVALFPHLEVRRNLTYGYRAAANPPALQLDHVIEILEIGALLERRPAALSGGEKQRVALGRALLSGPGLLLLDEPLSSLDRPLRARLLPYLRRVRDEFRVPMLFVSHDSEEIGSLCDRVLAMERGTISGSVARTGLKETKADVN